MNSLPKPLMIHDWYAWCGALHLRRIAANFSDRDRSPSASWTVHSAAADPATLRARPPAGEPCWTLLAGRLGQRQRISSSRRHRDKEQDRTMFIFRLLAEVNVAE